jgi:hypothetical protein
MQSASHAIFTAIVAALVTLEDRWENGTLRSNTLRTSELLLKNRRFTYYAHARLWVISVIACLQQLGSPVRRFFATIERNMRLLASVALLLLASSAFAQTVSQSSSHAAKAIWEPPEWNFPQDVKATVPKEMVSTFRVSGYDITLEKTSMKDIQQRLGGVIGEKGDASDASEWLCFHGADAKGRWVLWLVNGEIDGSSVGSFQWQRLSNRDILDTRCHLLPKAGSVIQLPVSVQLGNKSSEVLKSLGSPTRKTNERLIYVHEHEAGGTRADPFISSNIVVVGLRNGMVWTIQVSKTISD